MPYTQADLTTIYTNTQVGIAPSAAVSQLLAAYAAQNAAGTLTDAQVLNAVLALANPTTAVALETYQFFTGGTPTAAGLAFLVNSPTNATDLNDSYYAQFNTVNRFLNFAANLGTGQGAGAAQFAASYGSLSLTDAVNVAYETIIGSGNAVAAGVDPNAGKAYIASQIGYFQTFAKQNNPNATAAQLDLIVKAEIVGYTLEEATKAGLGAYANATRNLLADLGPDNQANLGSNLLTNYGNSTGGAVTLTLGTDIANGNISNAPVATSSTGDTRANTLQDEDQLTGTGTNPTLNFTFGNIGLNGGNTITPKLTNIQTVNVAFTGSGTEGGSNSSNTTLSNPVLDLQDATGVAALNVSRISGTNSSVNVVNLQAEPTISVTDTNAPATTVNVITTDAALQGAADTASITLNSAQIAALVNRSGTGLGVSNTGGVESATLVSGAGTSAATNYVGQLNMPGLQTLTITGASNLELGTKNITTANLANNGFYAANPTGSAFGQAEASRFGAAFQAETGTLKTVDASGFTGASISVDLGFEVTGTSVQNSGGPVNFTYKGSAGADTVRMLGSIDASGDSIDGGAGTNTLAIYNQSSQTINPTKNGTTAASTITNFQALEIHAGTDDELQGGGTDETVTVNTSAITSTGTNAGLTTVLVRDEGQATYNAIAGVGGFIANGTGSQFYSAPEGPVNVVLNKLSAALGNAITVQHSTTGNNAIVGGTIGAGDTTAGITNSGLILTANLASDTGSDSVGITIAQQLNTDPRFNFTLTTGFQAGDGVTDGVVNSLTINDTDNESNTVLDTTATTHNNTITLKGGSTGTFFSMDATANMLRLDQGGLQYDGGKATQSSYVSNTIGATGAATVYQPGGIADVGTGAAERLVANTIDASGMASDVIIRVGDPTINASGGGNTTGAQTILMGTGNDTVIFDAIGGAAAEATAGLSISDKVSGGAGVDTLAIDGDVSAATSSHINIGASEWTNVSGFEILRLVGDAATGTNGSAAGVKVLATGGDVSKFGEAASDMGNNAYNLTLTNDFINANSTNVGGINRIVIINDDDPANDTAGVGNTAGTGVERGVTIDARTLVATNSFSYNGEEGSSQTADRFILSDANINGTAIINGGALVNASTSVASNNDVLEARNGAVVTIGDLANTSNVGTIEFTNDTAINQSSTLELDNATVDRMVTTYHGAGSATIGTERLTIHAIDNPTVAAATTGLTLDASQVTVASTATTSGFALDVLLGRGINSITASAGNDIVTELGNYATGTYAGVRDGGETNGTTQDTRVSIDALANNVAGTRAVTDTLNGGAGFDVLNTYGNNSFVGATITNFEQLIVHSTETITDRQYNDLVTNNGGAGPAVIFAGPGQHGLIIVHDATYTGPAADLSRISYQGSDISQETVQTGPGVATTGAPQTPAGFDTTPPAQPTGLTLAPASDSGTKGDNITNVTTGDMFIGAAEANSTDTLYERTGAAGSYVYNKVGTGSTDANGVLTATYTSATPLSQGAHTFLVSATDAAGNTSPIGNATTTTANTYTFNVDTSAPTSGTLTLDSASDSGISNSDRITNKTSLTFHFTGGENGSTATLFNDANNNGVVDAGEQLGTTQNVGAAGTADFTNVNWTAGDGTFNNVKVANTDATGNVSTTSLGALTIDTVAPQLVPGSSTPPDNGSGTAVAGNLKVTLHFNEAVTVTDITKLDFFDGNKGFTELSGSNAGGSGTQDISYNIASNQYADGDNIIVNILTGYGTDVAGNQVVQVVGSSTHNFTAHT